MHMLFLIQSGNSLTNKRNNSGPNTDPCGTPLRTTIFFNLIKELKRHIITIYENTFLPSKLLMLKIFDKNLGIS